MADIRPLYIDPDEISGTDLANLQAAEDGETVAQVCGGTGQNASSSDDLLYKLGLYAVSGKVQPTKLPNAEVGALGGIRLAGDLAGGSATAPTVSGILTKAIPTFPTSPSGATRFIAYDIDSGTFSWAASSGTGDVNSPALGGHLSKLAYFDADDGTSLASGPEMDSAGQGTLYVGTASNPTTTLTLGERGKALVSDKGAGLRGLKYDTPYPMEFFKKHWGIQAASGSAVFSTHGTHRAPVVEGTATLFSDANGEWIRLTDSAGTGYLGIHWPFYNISRFDNSILAMSVTFRLITDIVSQILWIGFVDTSPSGSATPVGVADYAAMVFTGSGGFTPYCRNSGGSSSGTGSASLSAGVVYTVTILVKASSTEFYLNDNNDYFATINTNQPTGTCSPVIITKSSATAKALDIQSMDIYGG